jgi:TIR domain
MSYEYDVFVSYCRAGEWERWVQRRFLRVFKHWLMEALGREPKIFLDSMLEDGIWPIKLALALSRSKVLVPLWTRSYFGSIWCLSELTHMYARQHLSSRSLIMPAVLHDGDSFPAPVKAIHYVQLQKYASPWAPPSKGLSDQIQQWTQAIARAIASAPEFDPSWEGQASNEFGLLFRADVADQTDVPSLG